MDHGDINQYLSALEAQLATESKDEFEIVVCGGAALSFLELSDRPTKDIDVLSFAETDRSGLVVIISEDPSDLFWIAADKVAFDYGLPSDWINLGPAAQVETGLPVGLNSRLVTKKYGDYLIVHYVSRFDLIFLKLYAAVDTAGRHLEDLIAMQPSGAEIKAAADWCLEQDVSIPFREELAQMLRGLGYEDIADRFL